MAEKTTRRGCSKWKWCGVIICLLITLGVSLFLIIYFVTLGVGDETHVAGSVDNENCKVSSSSNDTTLLQVMTYNTYLIYCFRDLFACEEEEARKVRVPKLTRWFQDRDEDIVFMQEVWSFHDELRDGMIESGYCNYVMTEEKRGSGLAIFSIYPIVEHDFTDWFDAFSRGKLSNDELTEEAFLADKGVLYAKIQRDDDSFIHVFNTHTQSDSLASGHSTRILQYEALTDFVDSKEIPKDELVIIAGDMNEDMYCNQFYCDHNYCQNQTHYKAMLQLLNADFPGLTGDNMFSYDINVNSILQAKYEGAEECTDRKELLDYILFREDHLNPTNSSICEILRAVDEDGNDLSDHLPMTCNLYF